MSNARRWPVVIVGLQVAVLGWLWAGRPAAAQVPDAGAQQQQVIDQLKATNDRLDKLLDLLGSGNLQVRVGATPPPRGR